MLGTAERLVVGFVEYLRREGLVVPTSAAIDFEEALGLVGATSRRLVVEVGLATLVKRAEDVPRYLELAAVFFGIGPQEAASVTMPSVVAFDDAGDDGDSMQEGVAERVVRYSALERLRRADLGALDAAERAEALRTRKRKKKK